MKRLVFVFVFFLLVGPVSAFTATYHCGTDSDGDDQYVFGFVSSVEGVDLFDYCENSTSLVEYYCSAGIVSTKVYICDYGCLDGKCRSAVCAPGECNIITNMFCSGGSWTTIDYCSQCGAFDSDCVGECDEGQCDYEAGKHCFDGDWISDYYCDQSLCGSVSDPNNLCEEVSVSGVESDCSDGLDNDNDGSFDCFDSDCSCDCVHGDVQACGSDIGECRQGVQICEFGSWGSCEGEVVPNTEWCDDGLDNDCDGEVDEVDCWCVPGEVRACGSDIGVCGTGVQQCSSSGVWGVCYGSGYSAPTKEVFDGLDNDCDGEVDEDFACQEGDSQPCGSSEGWCEEGVQVCVNGSWGECVGGVDPLMEVCNDHLDNDCDGLTDDEDDECVEGQFLKNFTSDEEVVEGCVDDEDCNSGYSCIDGSCIFYFEPREVDDQEAVVPSDVSSEGEGFDWIIFIVPLLLLVIAGLVVWYFFIRLKSGVRPKKERVGSSKTDSKKVARFNYKPVKISSGPSEEEEALRKSLEESKKIFK